MEHKKLAVRYILSSNTEALDDRITLPERNGHNTDRFLSDHHLEIETGRPRQEFLMSGKETCRAILIPPNIK